MNQRRMLGAILGIVASLAIASTAFATECVNASKKDQGAGAQVLFGPTGAIVWTTEGLARRVAQGIVNPDTGEGFHGLVAVDFDGDGVADFSTWSGVGVGDELPEAAQNNGPACRGVTDIAVFLSECGGG